VQRDSSVRHDVTPATTSEIVSQLAWGPVVDDSPEVGSMVLEGLVVEEEEPAGVVVFAEPLLLAGPDVGPAVPRDVLPVPAAVSVSPPLSSPQPARATATKPTDNENPFRLPLSMGGPYPVPRHAVQRQRTAAEAVSDATAASVGAQGSRTLLLSTLSRRACLFSTVAWWLAPIASLVVCSRIFEDTSRAVRNLPAEMHGFVCDRQQETAEVFGRGHTRRTLFLTD